MVKALYPEKMTVQTVSLVDKLRQLREVNQEIANCALAVIGDHLEPVSGELVLLSTAHISLRDKEGKQMGQELLRLQSTWSNGCCTYCSSRPCQW